MATGPVPCKHAMVDQPGSSLHPWHTTPWRWKPEAGLPKFLLVKQAIGHTAKPSDGGATLLKGDQVWRRSSGPEDRCHLSPAWVQELHRVGGSESRGQALGQLRAIPQEGCAGPKRRGVWKQGGVLGMFCFILFFTFLCQIPCGW